MDTRVHHKSRAQRRLEKLVAEKEAHEEAMRRYVIHPTPIPATTLVPRFHNIMAANERRREDVVRRSREITASREKPFSFWQRDLDEVAERRRNAEQQKTKEEDALQRPFHANPVPEFEQLEEWEYLHAYDPARREAVRQRAKETLESASLPPRMEAYKNTGLKEKLRKQKEREEMGGVDANYTFQPQVNHHIPPYRQLQEKFDEALEARKTNKPPTVPIDPTFHVKDSDPIEKVKMDMIEDEKHLKEQRWPFLAPRIEPRPAPPGTVKSVAPLGEKSERPTRTWELHVQTLAKEEEERQQKQIEEDEAKAKREERRAAMRRRITPLLHDRREEFRQRHEERLRLFIQAEKDKEERWKEERDRILKRVDERPFLFQDALKDQYAKEAAERFDDALRDNGVDPDEIDEEDEDVG